MDKLHNEDVVGLFEAILSLETVDECYSFFKDALTEREIIDIAQRLKAAKMLAAGKSYLVVGIETGMSTATISRVSKALERGSDGYKLVINRLKDKDSNA